MPGKNILLQAAEMRVGDVVLPRGTVITPVAFGLFATVGKTAVPTLPNPKVGVLVTGDELIEANMKPMGGQIRNSNGPMLVAEAVRVGALPRYLGIARDDAMIMKSMIREGLMTADILVLSGGVSAGKYDLVPEVLQDLGVTIHCQHVRMKPGKPLLFGTKGSTLVFGLPGNPVSAFVCFQQFVVPAIRKMAGHPDPGPEQFSLPLAQDFRTKNDRPTFHPARIERLAHGEVVHALPWQGSADLRALLRSNALLVLPAGEVTYQAGERVEVQRTGVSF
jgi:molybdopterin molybdotransferase